MKVSKANTRNFLPCAHCGADCIDTYIKRDRIKRDRFEEKQVWGVDLLCECGMTMHGEEMSSLQEAFEFVLRRWQARTMLHGEVVEAQIDDEFLTQIAETERFARQNTAHR